MGTATITYTDTVRNLGFDTTPHAYLWHVNMGWPLVDGGSRVIAPIEETAWALRPDAAGEQGPLTQAPPLHPTTQQVYDHRLRLDSAGTGRAAMVNDALPMSGGQTGLALEIAYDGRSMPSLFQWQYFKKGNYVVALEPCSTHVGTRADWRERSEFAMLSHDEARSYRLQLTPHAGAQAIADLATRLA